MNSRTDSGEINEVGQGDQPDRVTAGDDDEDEEEEPNEFFRGVREDPWGRWRRGREPIRELEIFKVRADASRHFGHREAEITVESGVLPDARFDGPPDWDSWELRFRGRWNATWSGSRLVDLSVDCFSGDLDEVIRLIFDPNDPVDLLAVYNAAFPGLWGLRIIADDMTTLTAADEICGHRCSARDPRLAVQIASRYPGVCEHSAWLEWELYSDDTKIESKRGTRALRDLTAARESITGEPSPGAHQTTEPKLLHTVASMLGRDGDPPPDMFPEPIGATLDLYTLIGSPALRELPDATLLRVQPEIAAALAANVTFPDAITAIRAADPARLPLWLDFTDDDGEPVRLRRGSGPSQPLYGVMVLDYDGDDDDDDEPDELDDPDADYSARIVVPFGRTAGLLERPFALCALGVGPDDAWRYPIPERKLSLLTAHRGGVAVKHARSKHDFIGTEPPITDAEIGREISGYVSRTTDWVLARVGAILSGLDDGLLLMEKVGGDRTFRLVSAPQTRGPRDRRAPDAQHLVAQLRALGSLRRVADAESVDIVAVREALDRAGVDADQVRRDEVIRRFRRRGSVDAVVGELHLFRSEVERFLTEAGVDFTKTAVPHDVTNPDVLAAITAYQEHGTFDAAGGALGVSGETVRRRLARAGMNADDVVTDPQRQAAREAVQAWEAEGHSLAGAARRLALDPRTVKERLRQAGVSAMAAGSAGERAAEARHLFNVVGSAPQVAALMGVSTSTVRRYLDGGVKPRRGRPRISDGALDQVELALEEHGTVRAAARSLGMSVGGFSHRLKLARARHEAAPASQPKDVSLPGPAKAKEK